MKAMKMKRSSVHLAGAASSRRSPSPAGAWRLPSPIVPGAIVPALIALATLFFAVAPRAEIIEQVLVKVNGEIFTKTDLEVRQVAALRQLGQQANAKANLSDVQLRQMLDEVTPQLMVNVIDEMLLLQRGKELGYKMGDEQFKSMLEQIKKDNKMETEEQFEAALKQENMTLADLRKNFERTMIISRVQQNEVANKVSVNEEEARKYYQAHLAELTTPPTISLREIFINTPGDGKTLNVGLDEETRAKAEQIRKRALAGDSFEKLAADFSDAASRSNAGLIGPLNLNELSVDIRKMVEPMKVGDITEVLRGARGYQILKLEARSAPVTMPFEQARADIGNKIANERRNEEAQKYLVRLRSQAIIEWKNEDLKKAYELGLNQAKTGTVPAI
jgi:peptidyl-prolyl cis-trans isomerase SurA